MPPMHASAGVGLGWLVRAVQRAFFFSLFACLLVCLPACHACLVIYYFPASLLQVGRQVLCLGPGGYGSIRSVLPG